MPYDSCINVFKRLKHFLHLYNKILSVLYLLKQKIREFYKDQALFSTKQFTRHYGTDFPSAEHIIDHTEENIY